MDKKVLISIWFVLMTLIGVTVTYASLNYPEEFTLIDKKYHLTASDPRDSSVVYAIDIDEDGKFSVLTSKLANPLNEEPEPIYGNFTSTEFEKFKKLVVYIKNMYVLDSKNYLFYYDYSDKNDISSKDAESIQNVALAIVNIGEGERKNGNALLDDAMVKLGNSVGNYREVKFTEKAISGNYKVVVGGREMAVEIRDKQLFIDSVLTPLESDFNEVYAIDIDNDGLVEIISRTCDLRISPATNHYFIYRISAEGTLVESLKISIMGSIDTLYVDGNDIMIKYEPFEAKAGYVEKGQYTLK